MLVQNLGGTCEKLEGSFRVVGWGMVAGIGMLWAPGSLDGQAITTLIGDILQLQQALNEDLNEGSSE